MKTFSTALLAAVAAGTALAQTPDYGTGLVEALRSAGLTTLASAAGNASDLIIALQAGGNKTVLAPSNDAFAALGNISNDALIATLQYHVLNGTILVGDIPESGNLIVNSFLNNPEYVQLPNNASQVVVLSRTGDNSYSIIEASQNASFASQQDGPTYQNLLVQPINTVLNIPGNLSSVVTALNATQLASALTQANLLETLQNSRNGLTVFAPTDAAFEAAQSTISAATPEQLTNVLATHVINGTVAYSTLLTGENPVTSAVSASGNNLTFAMVDGGLTVTSGNATARIIRTDVLSRNGVLHVIDAVLANTEANPGAASSAFDSATAAAATQTASSGGNAGTGSAGAPNAAAKVAGGAALVLAAVGGALVALAA